MTISNTSNFTIILILIISVGGSWWYITDQKQKLVTTSNALIAAHETNLSNLSQSLGNTAVPVNAPKVVDCDPKDRALFDQKLGQLSTLSYGEVEALEDLFGKCAYYFAMVRSIKTNLLERELEAYQNQLSVIAPIDDRAAEKLNTISVWSELVEKANEQTDLTYELVAIQAEIIDLLLQGNAVTSEAVSEKVSEGQEIRENLVFNDQQLKQLQPEV